ncbi:uncharacterized protein LOC132643998 [Lycium barbarum]|uniref:uncharacterized protein LOC132643998 n=1 Tax=Lycium barbarum TaxID=112863 RepID=UPI00293F7396|nr:uncharacterized protein LOC132643998 [Lycium barbarum]
MVLQLAQAELKKYMHYEEEFWRQKSHFTCFSEGDRNTRFFHNMVNGRRKRLQVKRMKKQDRSWIEGENALAEEATQFYHHQFTQEDISSGENQILMSMPTLEDVKNAVFDLSGDSSGGPDGMLGVFYQVCWEIVRADVYNVVKVFFEGQTLPKSITHTNLVLIPKRNNVETFADMRPISLSNFINKVISRVVQNKLEKVLPSLISANQSGFVKGRCIIENVLLTQEVVSDIRLRGKPANVASGFFHSTRGVKQGDPLSPALFILSAEEYEQMSGQFINRGKSSFYMHSCPITHARKRKADYSDLIKKVKDKLAAWKGRLLSFGGKAVLISSVLLSMPIHLLSAIRPPKGVIYDLHRVFARFYWNNSEEGRKRHWSSWMNLCLPKEEGGVGFRSLFDVSKALCDKLWWKFRTTNTLWSNYMWNKYCKRHYPQYVPWKGGSQVWKMMLEARDNMEHEMWWEPRSGTANIWFDNWTKLGALYYLVPNDFIVDETVQELDFYESTEEWDKPRWMMTTSGLPFKISFFFWRLWKCKLPVGDIVRRIGIDTEGKCYYCDPKQCETVDHLFVTGKIASQVWRYVKPAVGITTTMLQVKQVIQSHSSDHNVANIEVEKHYGAWREDDNQ